MPKLPLLGGAYEARSVIAEAQRCVNLYPEGNPQDAEVPLTHYPTPGLSQLVQGPEAPVRGLYLATSGQLFCVIGRVLYTVSPSWVLNAVGTLSDLTTPVSMVDNGIELIVVDGPTGFQVNLTTLVFAQITDESFLGADFVGYLDTFLLFNRPDTKQFYSSLSNSVEFDPLYIASKTGFPDLLVALLVVHREIWLLGERTTEVWYNSGAGDFPFQILPGVFIEHGCIAKYSAARHGLMTFWLAQDKDGKAIVAMGVSYNAMRISTHAIELAIASYSTISDAIGFVYQQEGHVFYFLTFPTADRTWVYDLGTKLWHERVWIDEDGAEHRHRANCATLAYGKIVVGDWENGKLYQFDLNTYTDNGDPIKRMRGFQHIVNDGKRVAYRQFLADLEGGGTEVEADSLISLRWSDDRGRSWSNPVLQQLGQVGQYKTQPQWRRLGMARDRVFELSWSVNAKTALNGAYVDPMPLGS